MIVAGRVVMKMLPVLQRIWLQMPEPKWCISMGAAPHLTEVFDTYAVVQESTASFPVDMLRCTRLSATPKQLIQSIIDLQDKIQAEGTITGEEFDLPSRQRRKRAAHRVAGPAVAPAPGTQIGKHVRARLCL